MQVDQNGTEYRVDIDPDGREVGLERTASGAIVTVRRPTDDLPQVLHLLSDECEALAALLAARAFDVRTSERNN